VVTRDDDPEGELERGAMADVVVRRGPWASRDIFLSGARADVRAIRSTLLDARVPAARISVEEFTPSSWSQAEGAPSA